MVIYQKKIIENKEYYNLLINSSYNFAEQNINGSKDKISDYLIKQVSDILKCELNNYKHKALHFWKYAMSEKNNNLGSLLDEDLKIIVCGDWCMNGKVEGIFKRQRCCQQTFKIYLIYKNYQNEVPIAPLKGPVGFLVIQPP